MTDITDARTIIQEEETRFRAPVSESMFTRVGGAINFINNRQYDSHPWHLNGPYAQFGTAPGPDGVFPVLVDIELFGYIMYSGTTGVSGITILDIHRLSGGGTDNGSIFSTRPQISTAAANGSYSFINVIDSIDLALPTGHTKAVFSSTQFNAGDALRLDIDSAMSGAQNINFQLLFRPR